MSIDSLKLTDEQIAAKGVVAAPDILIGSAHENKKIFDRLIREAVKGIINGLIDALSAETGAGEIGAKVEGMDGATVQEILTAMKYAVDSKASEAATAAALLLKADASETAGHFKSVDFDATTGKFTFTKQNGAFTEIDTGLEKVATNWDYDADAQALVITLEDGSTRSVSLANFITPTEFVDSAQIEFSHSGGRVTATLKEGSIGTDVLALEIKNLFVSYVAAAAGHAGEAKQSEQNAAASAASASASAVEADKNAARAEAAQLHPPKIGDNGHWWIWGGGGYEDSGTPANGVYVGSGEMPEDCNVQIDPNGTEDDALVLTTPQNLSEEAKAQARQNIGAAKEQDDTETIALLIDTDMLPAVYNADGAILTDENGNVILRY